MALKRCPYCSEQIDSRAIKCKHCNSKTFDFDIYMSKREFDYVWIFNVVVFFVAFHGTRVLINPGGLNFLNAIIIVGACFATYVVIALIVRRFYHYNNYLTEYNKLLHESYETKDSSKHKETSSSIRSKEDAHDYKYFPDLDEYEKKGYSEKSPSKSFKTTTIKEADNLIYSQNKSASDDLKLKGFKVIKKIKQK